MELKEFKEKVFSLAAEAGFSEYEIYYNKNNSININVYDAEVDKYTVSGSMGLSFRGIYQGKMGYAYTEKLEETAVETLVNSARDNALAIDNEDEEFIYSGSDSYSSFNGYNEELAQVGPEKNIEFALELERQARSRSEKVVNIEYCGVGAEEFEYGIMNSKGLDLKYKSNFVFGAVMPVVTDGSRMYSGISFRVGNKVGDMDAAVIAEEAVDEAIACIGAAPVKSGNYKAALRNDVASALLRTFAGAFSAENVQKGLSLLKGKTGELIASDKVNIIDDPLMEGGIKSSPFDAEGAATFKKAVVDKGRLHTLLYNLKTAAKDGVKTTGNASKSSYAAPVTVAPTNFYIQAGGKSFPELLKFLGDGLLITEIAGTHAGANPVTGDFSLASKGYIIKDGRLGRPVEQITIAGNFFNLLQNIEAVGEDIKFEEPFGNGYFGSPTLIVKEISVAGN